jgi:hypothetical protein
LRPHFIGARWPGGDSEAIPGNSESLAAGVVARTVVLRRLGLTTMIDIRPRHHASENPYEYFHLFLKE